MVGIIFLVLGLIIGSFLNVVVYRLNIAETILGRSHCPHCKKTIRWHDNIPLLSFILLGARCRECREPISWQYPLVELATGLLFSLVGIFFFKPDDIASLLPTAYYLGIISLLVVLFVYDLRYMEVPMLIVWIAVGWSAAYYITADIQLAQSITSPFQLGTFSAVVAGASAFLFFFTLSFISKETWMGMGDAYVAMVAGIVVGWPAILLALMAAFTLGAVWGVGLILFFKKTFRTQVPFAPFLVIGTLLMIFLPVIFPSFQSDLFWLGR